LIMAPTNRPMMNGRTTGISQAISGGIDIVLPKPNSFCLQKVSETLI
jgi:hypothetical protein